MIPLYKPMYYIDSLFSLSNNEFILLFNIFNENNGPLIVDQKKLVPLDLSHFYTCGIASFKKCDIKIMVLNVNKKYDKKEEFEFILNALVNESIRRNLYHDSDSDSEDELYF
tara:strand:+ start:2062 stop:2397 length:336 start_codon:yes stop_codon:yes gene_type:complete